MTARDLRTLALDLPDAIESAHMGHPDFRVGGKIFATLGPDEAYGVVLLTPEVRRALLEAWRLRAPKGLIAGGGS